MAPHRGSVTATFLAAVALLLWPCPPAAQGALVLPCTIFMDGNFHAVLRYGVPAQTALVVLDHSSPRIELFAPPASASQSFAADSPLNSTCGSELFYLGGNRVRLRVCFAPGSPFLAKTHPLYRPGLQGSLGILPGSPLWRYWTEASFHPGAMYLGRAGPALYGGGLALWDSAGGAVWPLESVLGAGVSATTARGTGATIRLDSRRFSTAGTAEGGVACAAPVGARSEGGHPVPWGTLCVPLAPEASVETRGGHERRAASPPPADPVAIVLGAYWLQGVVIRADYVHGTAIITPMPRRTAGDLSFNRTFVPVVLCACAFFVAALLGSASDSGEGATPTRADGLFHAYTCLVCAVVMACNAFGMETAYAVTHVSGTHGLPLIASGALFACASLVHSTYRFLGGGRANDDGVLTFTAVCSSLLTAWTCFVDERYVQVQSVYMAASAVALCGVTTAAALRRLSDPKCARVQSWTVCLFCAASYAFLLFYNFFPAFLAEEKRRTSDPRLASVLFACLCAASPASYLCGMYAVRASRGRAFSQDILIPG